MLGWRTIILTPVLHHWPEKCGRQCRAVHGRGGWVGGGERASVQGKIVITTLPRHVGSLHVGSGCRLREETSVKAPPMTEEKARCHAKNTENPREEWWQLL